MKVVGFVGTSGSGKTTVIEQVVARLADTGLRVGVLKHARHGFDMDRPGKDSYRADLAVRGRSNASMVSAVEAISKIPGVDVVSTSRSD